MRDYPRWVYSVKRPKGVIVNSKEEEDNLIKEEGEQFDNPDLSKKIHTPDKDKQEGYVDGYVASAKYPERRKVVSGPPPGEQERRCENKLRNKKA